MPEKVVKLLIEGDIRPKDVFLEAWGIPDLAFGAADCRKFLEENQDATDIDVEIRTNGGSCTEGFDIHDQLVNSGKNIRTIGYNVKSIGTVIFMSGTTRTLSENAEFLVHMPTIDPWMFGPMTSEDLEKLSEEVKFYDNKILDFYCDKIEGANREELEALMKEDKNISPAEALRLGFATSVSKGSGANKAKAMKAMFLTPHAIACIQNTKNNITMSEKTLLEKFNELKKTVENVLKGKSPVKNASVKTEDGTTTIYFEGEAIAVDTVCYSDEAMTTVLAEGSYTLEGGKTITVGAEGKVTEVKEPASENEQVQKLNEQLANEKKEKDALAKKITEMEAAAAENKKQLTGIQNTLKELEALIPGEKKVEDRKEKKKKDPKDMTIADKIAARARS